MKRGPYVRPEPQSLSEPEDMTKSATRDFGWALLIASLGLWNMLQAPMVGANFLTLAGMTGFVGGGAWLALILYRKLES